MIQDYHLFQKYPLKSIISLTHINSKYKPPWVHLFHHFFFKMLLIFSDYAAEIWNVPGVAKPALIDLCVRQAKFRHAFITVEVFPFFFFPGWSVCEEYECHSSVLTFAGSPHRKDSPALARSRQKGPNRCVLCFSLPSPQPLSALSSLLLVTECQKPSYWQLPPRLRTDLRLHFHFVLWMAFSVYRLCFLPAHLLTRKNISEGWEHGNKIFFSFFIKGK